MKLVIVDARGLYVFGSDMEIPLEEGQRIVLGDVPEGFFHPRHDGKKWVEGLSPAEIEARKNPKPPESLA
ncbi:MAG TPA: hypothetical protein V6D33_12615 [Cyanophyceae cyanobacterium]